MRQPGLYTEAEISMQIRHYLQAKGYYVMRLNSGRYRVGEGKASRFIMGQEAGTPDLQAFRAWPDYLGYPRHDLVFIEVKVPGKKPTPLQFAKMQELETYGARCIVATSIEDVQRQL